MYTRDLTLYLIDEISKNSIYEKQINNKDINVLTGENFDGFTTTLESIQKQLGIYEKNDPSSISIYPKDYKSKQS